MRTETIFDRVPGCRDKRKAKRAANRMCAIDSAMSRRVGRLIGIKSATRTAARRAFIHRLYAAQAAL